MSLTVVKTLARVKDKLQQAMMIPSRPYTRDGGQTHDPKSELQSQEPRSCGPHRPRYWPNRHPSAPLERFAALVSHRMFIGESVEVGEAGQARPRRQQRRGHDKAELARLRHLSPAEFERNAARQAAA
jgi:hypothetical protein